METTNSAMKQYEDMKQKYPDAVLLFRTGDSYETYRDDAIVCAELLRLTLARRLYNGKQVELAGFPYNALDTYLPKLVRAGKRVAICDQLEKPKPRNTPSEVVTPAKVITKKPLTETATAVANIPQYRQLTLDF